MRQQDLNARLNNALTANQLLPVVTVSSADHALTVCENLQQQGINCAEITLRTASAMDALAAARAAYPDMVIAAGSVKTPDQMRAVAEIGVDFAVSPGMTATLIETSQKLGLPYLPGVATPSEMLKAGEYGLEYLKLFPAVPVGGLSLLKSIAAPLSHFKFCPTGGLNEANYRDFLALPNVVCVGGSWMVVD